MRLLIDETFATGMYAIPIASGWVTPGAGLDVEIIPGLAAADVAVNDAALVSAGSLLALQQSHEVFPGVAVIADGVGAVAMRVPVRPDEVEATPVRLLDTGAAAELLARATLKPFYGIAPTTWVTDGAAPDAVLAQVVIVEGAEALREPEGGFSEDLCRAWFILTARPFVSHVLALPRELDPGFQSQIVAFLVAAREAGHARRREWRTALADQLGVPRDRGGAFWAAQRLSMEANDRAALLDLLHQGARGTTFASPSNVQFWNGSGES